MTIQVFVNGSGPAIPMAETGLPTIQMHWFINGSSAITATITGAFNVANPGSSGNVITFDLMDDQPSIGGTIAVGTCAQTDTQPAIAVFLNSDTFIVGQGTATLPAVSAVPQIVNGFNAANVATSAGTSGGTTTTTAPTTSTGATTAPTTSTGKAATSTTSTGLSSGGKAGIAIFVVVGVFGIGAGFIYYKKKQSGEGFRFSTRASGMKSSKPLVSPNTKGDTYVSMDKNKS
eukprot:TRINITY_DN1694_c0_g1_i2.p1 TRINITY_DN1694_c0_g1~~TRINITY_DN1694_c0_g1_i2.p1  ORF type:complete len:232 (-),score=51.61 TRINITY_DN1694_c0_g1_i2:392-1087(-)